MEWDDHNHGRTASRRAGDVKMSGERFHPVLEPDQPRARTRDGAADPVVADGQVKLTLTGDGGYDDATRLRMFGRIGQRLGDHVIGGDLNGFRQSAIDVQVEVDRN